MRTWRVFLSALVLAACTSPAANDLLVPEKIVPSQALSESLRNGEERDFTIYHASAPTTDESSMRKASLSKEEADTGDGVLENANAGFAGDQRYLDDGLKYHGSVEVPSLRFTKDGDSAGQFGEPEHRQIPRPPSIPSPLPPGSQAPYFRGQMLSNPSLWPDEGEGASLFTDFRAFRPMDVLTVVINESSKGKKKAETEADNEYSLTAGISEFFGVETKRWASNNESLSPAEMIKASTQAEYEGSGETEREGTLSAKLSAVIMEVFPNGLLRIEGTKIVSINSEEEIMVLSGLVRQRDINALNQVDSSRVANMRVDFYGRGTLGDQQRMGWGARVVKWIWPF